MKKYFATAFANSLAVFLLLVLIGAPFYFAQNFSQIAGVKSQSSYLLISQVEKFPGMTFSQDSNTYTIAFTKAAPSQAYLSILVINNPTNESKSYQIKSLTTKNNIFFGEDLQKQLAKINIPSQSSAPLSLISPDGADDTISFQILSN